MSAAAGTRNIHGESIVTISAGKSAVLSTVLNGNADSTTGAHVSIPVFSQDSIDNWRMEQNISQGYYLRSACYVARAWEIIRLSRRIMDKPYDLRLDLPARAYINAQLLALIERGATLLEAKKHLFSTNPLYRDHEFDVYGWPIQDYSQLLGLLYCAVVVPREILDLPANHTLYRELHDADLLTLFDIRKPNPCDPFALIRGVRHAVAHALFEIKVEKAEVCYRFWNDRQDFEVQISEPALRKSVELIGSRLSSAALQRKSGGPATR